MYTAIIQWNHILSMKEKFINRTSKINEYCAIYSNKELLVVQLSHGGEENNGNGDSMMALVPDAKSVFE